jgi:hypothetical protein
LHPGSNFREGGKFSLSWSLHCYPWQSKFIIARLPKGDPGYPIVGETKMLKFEDFRIGMRVQSNLGDGSQGRRGKITDTDASDRSIVITWDTYGTERHIFEHHLHLLHPLDDGMDTLPSIPLAAPVEKKTGNKSLSDEEERAKLMAFFRKPAVPNSCFKCGAPSTPDNPCRYHPFNYAGRS